MPVALADGPVARPRGNHGGLLPARGRTHGRRSDSSYAILSLRFVGVEELCRFSDADDGDADLNSAGAEQSWSRMTRAREAVGRLWPYRPRSRGPTMKIVGPGRRARPVTYRPNEGRRRSQPATARGRCRVDRGDGNLLLDRRRALGALLSGPRWQELRGAPSNPSLKGLGPAAEHAARAKDLAEAGA